MRYQVKKLTVADLPIGSKYMSPDGPCIKASNLRSYGLSYATEVDHSDLDLCKTTPLAFYAGPNDTNFKSVPNGASFKHNGDLCMKSACGEFAIRMCDGRILDKISPLSQITEVDGTILLEPIAGEPDDAEET